MTVGLDGGYVRAAHKEGCFEVIAGRSVVAFRRREEDAVPPPKCFGFVQTYDRKPRRRLWELMKSQGMQENQQVVFLSDGGEDVRQVREYLHPNSEHVIDWFHITMRLTVLQQQTKAVKEERPETGAAASNWHRGTRQINEQTEVLQTTRMVSQEWRLQVTAPGAVACLRTVLTQSFAVTGLKLVSFKRISFPKLGTYFRYHSTFSFPLPDRGPRL